MVGLTTISSMSTSQYVVELDSSVVVVWLAHLCLST